jgi:hypothetical protein
MRGLFNRVCRRQSKAARAIIICAFLAHLAGDRFSPKLSG